MWILGDVRLMRISTILYRLLGDPRQSAMVLHPPGLFPEWESAQVELLMGLVHWNRKNNKYGSRTD